MRKRLLAGVVLVLFGAGCGNQPVTSEADVEGAAIDPEPRISFQVAPDMRFGLTALKDVQGNILNKRLTYAHDGRTNSTVLKIDGRVLTLGDFSGKWVEKAPFAHGHKAVWQSGPVKVSQILEIVPSQQPAIADGRPKRLLDTLLVRYLIENTDSKEHAAGLRFLLDTLIGTNDGVPFTVPGVGLVQTFKDFPNPADVPDFIQALEFGNLQNPGTVANLTLKMGGNTEPPTRISLTAWPNDRTGNYRPWDVPLFDFSRVRDSCVVVYWNERPLKAGEKRELALAYGLGRVSSSQATGGKLGLTLNGPFVPGESFSLTAYVKNPVKGQTLTLELPAGLELTAGKQTESAEVLKFGEATDTALVTWKIKARAVGTYTITVRTSTGIEQRQPVTIQLDRKKQ
jgi:hypothetical protein